MPLFLVRRPITFFDVISRFPSVAVILIYLIQVQCYFIRPHIIIITCDFNSLAGSFYIIDDDTIIDYFPCWFDDILYILFIFQRAR